MVKGEPGKALPTPSGSRVFRAWGGLTALPPRDAFPGGESRAVPCILLASLGGGPREATLKAQVPTKNVGPETHAQMAKTATLRSENPALEISRQIV
jgi:hypothetical protein